MTKKELIAKLQEQAQSRNETLSKATIERLVDDYQELIKETLLSGEKFAIHGLGSLETVERAARTGHNPKTKEVIHIPAKRTVRFNVSQGIKDELNK